MMAESQELHQVQQQADQGQFALAADELSSLSPDEQAELLQNLPDEQAAEVFKFMDTAYQEQALDKLSQQRVLSLLERLDPDDRARLLEQMPAPLARRLLSGLSPAERRMTSELLGYPPESAGRCMTREFQALTPGVTVREALAEIRSKGRAAETVYVLPVIRNDGRFLGVVHLRDLVMSDPDRQVEELIDPGIEPILATEDRERAARLIQTTDALAAPVVDSQGRLLGLVTVDDAMDILDRESAEDLARAGGASEPLNRPYFSVSVLRLARARVVWLLVLAIAAVLTVNVLNVFEETLEAVVTLALFIPLLIDTGGNAGAQSATTLVRAMSVGEVEPSDGLRILLREVSVGVLLGSMLAVISLIPVWLFAGGRIAVVALTAREHLRVGFSSWCSRPAGCPAHWDRSRRRQRSLYHHAHRCDRPDRLFPPGPRGFVVMRNAGAVCPGLAPVGMISDLHGRFALDGLDQVGGRTLCATC
jgi:magnesium transporter